MATARETMHRRRGVEQRGRDSSSDDARELLLAGIPVTERRLQLAGVCTAVLEGGDGPPVVLLHGPGEFALTGMRVIPDLVTTHHVVAPDLPGHGASQMADGPLDLDRMLAWLGELVETTCPSPPALVGHLLGGALGARFACTHGDRLDRLVLVDTFGLRRLRPAPRFALTLIAFLARPTDGSRDRFFRQCVVDFDGLRAQLGVRWEPLMAYALDRARTPSQKAALRSLVPQLGVPAIPSADLARIGVPTTLIWGRSDRQTPLRVAERASDAYGWPLHIIENAQTIPLSSSPKRSWKRCVSRSNLHTKGAHHDHERVRHGRTRG